MPNRLNIPGLHELSLNGPRSVGPMASSLSFHLGYEDNANRPLFSHIRMEPHQTAPPHAHRGWTCTLILEGSMFLGGVEFRPGEMVIAEPYVEYGPFEPGPKGVTLIEFFENLEAVPPIWDESDPRVAVQMKWSAEQGTPAGRGGFPRPIGADRRAP